MLFEYLFFLFLICHSLQLRFHFGVEAVGESAVEGAIVFGQYVGCRFVDNNIASEINGFQFSFKNPFVFGGYSDYLVYVFVLELFFDFLSHILKYTNIKC